MLEEGPNTRAGFPHPLLVALCLILLASAPALAAPSRIISLSPAVTEILFALGAGEKLVGVSDFCRYPPEATRLPKVGGFLNPSHEAMLALKPDLIIHQVDSSSTARFARQAGIPNLPLTMLTIEEILSAIETLGKRVELEEAQAALTGRIRSTLKARKAALAGVEHKTVFLLLGVGEDPAQTLYGVGPNTYLGELLALAGGDNILPASLAPYPKISKEFILAESPEVIIEVGPEPLPEEEVARKRQGWSRFASVRAVKNNAIHFLGGDELLVPGPRLTEVLARLSHALHPDLAAGEADDAKRTEAAP